MVCEPHLPSDRGLLLPVLVSHVRQRHRHTQRLYQERKQQAARRATLDPDWRPRRCVASRSSDRQQHFWIQRTWRKKQTRGNTCYHSLLFSIFCDRFHLTLSICKGIEGTWREEHVGTCYPSLLFVLCVLSERITPLARAFRCGDRTHVAGKTRGNTCCPSLLVFPFSVIPQIITPLARHLGHLLSHLSVIFS